MKTIKKFKICIFLFIGLFFLMSSTAMSLGKIRVFDFQYEEFKFLNGDVSLELPGKSNRNLYSMYYKVLMDKYIDLTSGYGEISLVNVNKYRGPREEEFKNKLVIQDIKRIYRDRLSISRTAVWYNKIPLILRVRTSFFKDTFPTESEKQDRIRKDDEIFEHIVESFRYRKEDGTYAQPEIIRQPEEVKEIKHTGVEYHKK